MFTITRLPCGHKIMPLLLFLGTPSMSTLPPDALSHCSKATDLFFLFKDPSLALFSSFISAFYICYSVCFMYLHKLILILSDYKW